MSKLIRSAVLVLMAVAGAVALAAAPAADPAVGTWKLNVAKSTFISGPALKSQTRIYSRSGQSFTAVMTTTGADGVEEKTQTTYQLDGKNYPVKGSPDYDTFSARQVDDNTAEFVLKRGDKVVGINSRTVSADGQTLTSKMKVTSAKGGQTESVLVFDKQ